EERDMSQRFLCPGHTHLSSHSATLRASNSARTNTVEGLRSCHAAVSLRYNLSILGDGAKVGLDSEGQPEFCSSRWTRDEEEEGGHGA
ncbi:Aquaporin, partial [Dissostichus eleginoides]